MALHEGASCEPRERAEHGHVEQHHAPVAGRAARDSE